VRTPAARERRTVQLAGRFTLLLGETLSAAELAGLASADDATVLRSYLAWPPLNSPSRWPSTPLRIGPQLPFALTLRVGRRAPCLGPCASLWPSLLALGPSRLALTLAESRPACLPLVLALRVGRHVLRWPWCLALTLTPRPPRPARLLSESPLALTG
jgi:hypothetical protein